MSPHRRRLAVPYDWQDHDEQYNPSRWDAPHRERRRDEDPYQSDEDEVVEPEDENEDENSDDEDTDNDSLGGRA
jgi:hypothetical protein